MFRVEVHKHIERIIKFFLQIGLWHREESVREWRIKFTYSIYYCFFLISLVTGALRSDNRAEIIFLVQTSIMAAVSLVKLMHIIWRKTEILELLNRVCDFYVKEYDIFTVINEKLKDLMKFVAVFLSVAYICGICTAFVAPFIGQEKKPFLSIGFPLDWKNDKYAFWIVVTFIFTELILTSISVLFSVIIWYLLTNCGLRFTVLGERIRNMGKIESVEGTSKKRKVLKIERDNLYHQELHQCIASHIYLKE